MVGMLHKHHESEDLVRRSRMTNEADIIRIVHKYAIVIPSAYDVMQN